VILEDNEVALTELRFDRPRELVRQFGIIAASARTGSHMLCRLLRQLGLGVPLEYFYPRYRRLFEARWHASSSPAAYLSAISQHRTAGGVCIVKCLPQQYPALQAAIDGGVQLPAPFVIHLWRRDSLAQAISLRLAMQSGFWNYTAAPTTQPRDDVVVEDLVALRSARQRLLVDELLWRARLRQCGWRVFHLSYEELIADRASSLGRLIASLNLDQKFGPLPELAEPATPEALYARQSLGTEQRAALAAAYIAQFGPTEPLPEP
jgi:LPS sulfotransferase NodH